MQTVTPATSLSPESFLSKLTQQQPLNDSQGHELPRSVPFRKWDGANRRWEPTQALVCAVDNGNDAFKGAMLHAKTPTMITKRILTAYMPARKVRGGEGVVTWQVNDSEEFWIGEDAVESKKVENLPIGYTSERLHDERYQGYLAACLIELLIEAGYGQRDRDGYLIGEWQGEHNLYSSFGVPNEEVTLTGPIAETSAALRLIFNIPFNVIRTDERGQQTQWRVRLVEINPYPQSFASFAAWYYTVDGTPIDTRIVKHVTIDVGGGQTHSCEVDLIHRADAPVKLRMEAKLLGEGTISIARPMRDAIRARYKGVHLSDPGAQYALMTRQVAVAGTLTDIDTLVADVIAARSKQLLSPILEYIQEGQNYLMFTGGGRVLLERQLREMVAPTRTEGQYLFVDPKLSAVLNAIGGYVLAQAAARKILAAAAEQQRSLSALS
ncbi:MAG: hypothetical protein ACYDER_08000 [Ktedonobacteraceae bacterium]